MDFKKIENDFVKKRTTRYVYTKYNNYELKWAFENFETLISKPTFQASISTNLDFQLNHNLILELDQKIDDLRKFYQETSVALQKYLNEVNDENFSTNTYNDFLNNFYKGLKDYVNDGLIPWVYANVMHKPIIFDSKFYNPDNYLKYLDAKFRYKIMQKMRLYIKAIGLKLPNDEIFKILSNAYENEISTTQKKLQELKQTSEI